MLFCSFHLGVEAQVPVPATTSFTRGLLKTTSQATAQAYLGTSGGGGATNGIQQLNGTGTNTTFTSSGATVPITVSQPNNAHSQNWDGNNNNHAFLDSNENFVTTGLVHGSNITFKSIQDVGVVGTVDDTAVIQAAAYLGQPIYFDSSVVYTVTNTIQFTNNTAFVGCNAILKLAGGFDGDLINTSTNITNCILTGFILDGQRIGFTNSSGTKAWGMGGATNVTTATTHARSGIRWNANMIGGSVHDCIALNWSDTGFRFIGGRGDAFIPTNYNTFAYSLAAGNCYAGFWMTNGAEYLNLQNLYANGCGYGVIKGSANDKITTAQLDWCGCAFRATGLGGLNAGHGDNIGITANHSSVWFQIDNMANGETFTDCRGMVGGLDWPGFILITNAAGVHFIGGLFTPSAGGAVVVDAGANTTAGTNYFTDVIGIGNQANTTYATTPIFTPNSGKATVCNAAFGSLSNLVSGDTLTLSGTMTAAQYITKQSNLGGATAIDWSKFNIYYTNLASSVTFTFANNVDAEALTVVITGDASHTVTWPGTVKWPGTTAPTQTLSKTDVYTFIQANGNVYGSSITNY